MNSYYKYNDLNSNLFYKNSAIFIPQHKKPRTKSLKRSKYGK